MEDSEKKQLREEILQEIEKERQEKNKKNLKIIGIVVAVIVVMVIIFGLAYDAKTNSSSTSTYTKTVEELSVEYALKSLRANLKDPSSLQVHSATVYKNIQDDSLVYIVIDAGAKNGFGGMGRDLYLYSAMGTYLTNDSEKSGKEKISEVMSNKQYKKEKISTGKLNF